MWIINFLTGCLRNNMKWTKWTWRATKHAIFCCLFVYLFIRLRNLQQISGRVTTTVYTYYSGPLKITKYSQKGYTTQNNMPRYRNTQHSTMQCNTIRYDTIQYNTIRYNTIRYDTIQYDTIQYDTIQYNTIQSNCGVIFLFLFCS